MNHPSAHQVLVRHLFEAIAAADEAALPALLVPGEQTDIMWQLWGFPGLRLILGWQDTRVPDFTVEELPWEQGFGLLAVRWEAPPGARHEASLWLTREPTARFYRVVAESRGTGKREPAFEAAMIEGRLPPWRAEAPDLVEAKLRKAMVARRYGLDAQTVILRLWREMRPLIPDPSKAPEAWAAAIEGAYWGTRGRQMSPAEMADLYGARKSTVKQYVDQLNNAFETRDRQKSGG